MSYMTLRVELPESGFYVEFTGSQCEVWQGIVPFYRGAIEGMPPNALQEALKLEYIKQVSH